MKSIEKMKTADIAKRFSYCRRILINKSITQLSRNHSFGYSTLIKWEKGALAITPKNITKIVQMFNIEGVICSEEWLLYGKGKDPSFVQKDRNVATFHNLDSSDPTNTTEHIRIFNEVEFFKRNNENPMVRLIVDEAMSPLYRLGDYVGGIKIEPQLYSLMNHRNCIINIPSQRCYIRQFFKTEKGCILLPFQTSDTYLPIVLENQSFDLYLISYHRVDISHIIHESSSDTAVEA